VWLAVGAALIVALALAVKFVLPRSHLLWPPRASNGVTYSLYAHVPEACRAAPCPALYILDGDLWVPTFARIVDERVRARRMAPIILVGIGYRDIWNVIWRRKHDFTPAFGRTPNRTGGADAYLEVLRDELIPYAEAHLRISRESRGLAGHSYAGLLATYALQRAPDLFDHYIIISPALWFDGGKIYAQPFAAATRTRQVFLAADTPGRSRGAMARDVIRLADLLSGQSDVAVSRALIVGADHNSMVGPAARRGIDAVYGIESNASPLAP
jgi:predicted alpha/beta superfamily hydrolase